MQSSDICGLTFVVDSYRLSKSLKSTYLLSTSVFRKPEQLYDSSVFINACSLAFKVQQVHQLSTIFTYKHKHKNFVDMNVTTNGELNGYHFHFMDNIVETSSSSRPCINFMINICFQLKAYTKCQINIHNSHQYKM